MKLLRLEICNIASLTDQAGQPQVIDFTTEPLVHAHLLAITGPTGAGKSTLLDALCLALYDKVPRLQGLGRTGKTRDPEGSARISGHTNSLLTRGKGHGHCVVDFISHDGHRYQARWAVRRARDKPTGALQAVSRSLINLDTGVTLSTQTKQTNSLIQEKIGLNFDQFSRSVLLAQSEFSAFLKATDAERAELLESLTDTQIYSQLGQLAYRQHQQHRKDVEQLERHFDGMQPLDDDDLTALQQQLQQTEQDLQATQQQRDQLQQQRHLSQQQQAYREQLSAQQRQQQALLALQPSIEALTVQTSRIQQCSNLRHWLAEQQTLQQTLQQLERDIGQLEQQLAEQQQTLQPLERQWTEQRQAWSELEAQHHAEQPLLRTAQDLEAQIAELQGEWRSQNQQLAQAIEQTKSLESQTNSLSEQRQALLLQRQQHQHALAQSADLAGLEAYPSQWMPDQLKHLLKQCDPTVHGDPLALAARIDTLRSQLRATDTQPPEQQLSQLLEQQQQLQQHLQQAEHSARQIALHQHLQQQIDQAQQQRQQLTEQMHSHAPVLQAAEHTLITQQQQLSQAQIDWQHLRNQLHEGEPCPLCGSATHPHPPRALQANARHALEQAVQQQQTHVEQLRRQATRLELSLTQLDEHIQSLQLQLADVPAITADQQAEVQQINHWQHQLNRIHKDQQQLHRLMHQRQQLLQELQVVTQQAQQLQLRQQTEQQLTPLLPARWQVCWPVLSQPLEPHLLHPQLEDWQQQLQERLRTLQDLNSSATHLAELQSREHSLQPLLLQQKELQQQLQAKLEQSTQQGQALRQQLNTLLPSDCTRVQHWQDHRQQQRQQLHQQLQQQEHQLQQQRQHHRDTQQHLQLHQQRLQDQQLRWQDLHQQIEHWQQQYGTIPDDLHEWDDQRLQMALQQIADHHTACTHTLGHLAALTDQLQRLQQQHPELIALTDPAVLDGALVECQQHFQTLQQQSSQLQAQLHHDQALRGQQQQLMAQLQHARTALHRWHLINQLIGSAEGDKFRKIAQQYQLDLLLHYANHQLQDLFPRYQLQRTPDSLGLEVVDLDMGHDTRSAYSLSGGETFLVSLALALGLASMAAGHLHIESLFIDEGFGSLDQQTLQTAMDLLDKLQALGRRVIVISHVSEMQERIPIQIQIRPLQAGHSRIQIQGS